MSQLQLNFESGILSRRTEWINTIKKKKVLYILSITCLILFVHLANKVSFSKDRGPGCLLLMYVFIATVTCYLVSRDMLVAILSYLIKWTIPE